MNIISVISRTNERGPLLQCGGFLDGQIGMEPLVTDWAKEEAKIAKIIRYNHAYC